MFQDIRMNKVSFTWRGRWLAAVLLLGVVAGFVAAAEPKPAGGARSCRRDQRPED